MASEPEAAESFNTWVWDNAASGFRDLNTPDADARSLFELSGGRLNLVGTTIRDITTGQIVGNLSPVHGSTLSAGDQGTLLLNNGIGREDVNQAAGRNLLQRATITVHMPATETLPERNLSGTTSLTHFGGAIYTIQGAPSKLSDFERVDLVPDRALAGEASRFKAPLEVGLYRRATPSDVLRRSTAGWLARNAFAEIAERVEGLGFKNYMEKAQAIADAIDALGIMIEVTPFVTYDLSGNE